jgi:dipeptidyl aminopeptidase/acylaminoacyl peptidase
MKKTLLPFLLLGIAVAFAPAPVCHGQATGTLTPAHYFDYESVSDPQLSPDGRQVLYTRTWIDAVNDRQSGDLWIVGADGTANRYFLQGSQGRWSPDGSRVAFLREGKPGGTQIFVKHLGLEGDPTQVTREEEQPGNVTWSPDGRWLAFTRFVPSNNSWKVDLPAKPEGAKWTEAPRFVDQVVYRRDRVGFLETGYTHLFVVPADGGSARQVTQGDYDHSGSFAWTSDSKGIIFSSLREADADYAYRQSNLYRVDVATGNITPLTSRPGTESGPVVSPDGQQVAFTGSEWTENFYHKSQVYLMNIDGGNLRALSTNLDRSPGELFWAPDNSGVYFNVDDQGSRNLYFASARGGARQVTQGVHMLTVATVAGNGLAAGVRSDAQSPPDVVLFPLNQPGQVRQLTSVNDDLLFGMRLGEVEEIRYRSGDGLEIQGWIVRPPDFDPAKKYPLILTIHGGPHAMYNVGFDFRRQLHAAGGYVVLYTNPRGSTGYGYDFADAIQNAYPGKDYDDLMAGVDAVIARGYIDPQRLFVYGGSGGGVLTSWIIGQTDRFAAAGVLFPVINWLSFVGTTDGIGWYRNFRKLPWEDPSEHLARSPLMQVGKVKTPTVLMTGVNDLRTPISQTEEYYQALKMQRVPAVMIRFNEEFHGTSSKPSNYLRTTEAAAVFAVD